MQRSVLGDKRLIKKKWQRVYFLDPKKETEWSFRDMCSIKVRGR